MTFTSHHPASIFWLPSVARSRLFLFSLFPFSFSFYKSASLARSLYQCPAIPTTTTTRTGRARTAIPTISTILIGRDSIRLHRNGTLVNLSSLVMVNNLLTIHQPLNILYVALCFHFTLSHICTISFILNYPSYASHALDLRLGLRCGSYSSVLNGALANLDALFNPLVSSGLVPSSFLPPSFLPTTRSPIPVCTWTVSASAEHGSYSPAVAGPLPRGTPSRPLPPPRHVRRTPSASSSLSSCCSSSADCHRVSLLPETEGTFCQMAPSMGDPYCTRSQLTLYFLEPIDPLLGI